MQYRIAVERDALRRAILCFECLTKHAIATTYQASNGSRRYAIPRDQLHDSDTPTHHLHSNFSLSFHRFQKQKVYRNGKFAAKPLGLVVNLLIIYSIVH